MFPLGFLTLVFGTYLVDSAVQNRPPLTTLREIIGNPSGIYTVLSSTRGTYVAPTLNGLGTEAFTTASPGTGTTSGKPIESSSPAIGEAISYAAAQEGKPYKYGATGPNAFDCSGLVMKAYQAGGVKLPRTTAGMILVGKRVAKADLIPGDLVFPDLGHVQLYVGNGQVIEAPKTGEFVRKVNMWGFLTARRVVN